MDVETSIGDAAGNDAPSYGVDVEQAGEGGDDYEITAEGADAVFCMTVYRTKSADGPVVVPGSENTHVKQYGLKGRVKSGNC